MKNLMRLKTLLLLTLSIIFLISLTGQAGAATNTFNFDVTFSGMSPGSTTPYLTATFDDTADAVGANGVRLTIDVLNLDSSSSVTKLYFNFDSSLTSSALTFAPIYIDDSLPISVTGSANAYKADGDGLYDIYFDMPPPPGEFAARLTDGEKLVYDISYTSAINVSSFNYFSAPDGGQGVYFAAAHIQGIGDGSDSSSGWVGVVPEPVSSTLFIVGGAVLGFRRFRKMKKA